MTAVIARAAIVPLFSQPTLRSEQASQLVLGETAAVLESAGDWRRVRIDLDCYEGWVHAGYCVEVDDATAEAWRKEATGWSLGAVVRLGKGPAVRLPLRARVALESEAVRLPDGRRGQVAEGALACAAEAVQAARATPPERWALEYFAGSPYQWGGVTPGGVDCSGLVQTAFAARDTSLPRDAALQVECGAVVNLDASRPGDLVFFRGESVDRITHVAFAAAEDTLVHSTVACGGVLMESWLPGSRAGRLRDRLVAVRRLEVR